MAKRGKKKADPSFKEAILKALRLGHTDKDACTLAGVSTEAFYSWINGRPTKKIKPDSVFADEVKKARLASKDLHMKNIRRASLKSWVASAWFLERRYRDEFALKTITKNEEHVVHDLSEEALKRLGKYLDPEDRS